MSSGAGSPRDGGPWRPNRPGSVRPGTAAAALAALLLPLAALPRPAGAQETVPRVEDAELPGGGSARFRLQPFLQTWHEEFGPGPGGAKKVPLRADFDGPLLDRVFPGRQALLADLNGDAPDLGFDPVASGDASLGTLDARDVSVNVRGFLARLEVGLLDRLSVDAALPVLRTETEPFATFDPAGASLGPAATVVDNAVEFSSRLADARDALREQVESGQLGPEEEQQARALLEASGAFASALTGRLDANALIPLAGSAAGDQMLAHLAGLRSGFADFGLTFPELGLASGLSAGTLAGFIDFPVDVDVRGWLAGEPELGLRFLVLDDFARTPEERGGLESRTAVGARLRLPIGNANDAGFIQPSAALGVPLGDGQRDLELSLYQDVRVGGTLLLTATARYGIQRTDRLLMRARSPDLPFSNALVRTMERDLGDYVQARLAPRLALNPFLTVGAEYRYWHKGSDTYRIVGEGGGDASVLEAQTAQTRHRLGLGAFYRPAPPEEGEGGGAVPELGFVWQAAVAGTGGETPAAGLTTMHVRIPFRIF